MGKVSTITKDALHLSPIRNPRFKDIAGQRFGKLVAITYGGVVRRTLTGKTNNQSAWLCQCDCGTELYVLSSSLRGGASTSCGCNHLKVNGEASRGNASTEYKIWTGIIKRCCNPKNPHWHDYGGRGIKICERWRNSYLDFLSDVGRRPGSEYSLDRIDNNGNYEPGNIRWATRQQQIRNRRPVQKRNWRESAKHAYAVVKDFEDVISSYTGAPYVISCDSCTSAIMLACAYLRVNEVEIPKLTYISVPMSIVHAGGTVKFRDESWSGMYKLEPYPIYDSARLMTSGMYIPGSFMCLSFHWSKHLSIGRGGAVLFDNPDAVEWFTRARFDGRDVTKIGRAAYRAEQIGWHVNFTPPLAAQGLMLMASMREHNEPLPNSEYQDLSELEIFKERRPLPWWRAKEFF